ncbi:MOSC N-terminal beta barrel domain-containing protein [Sphaerospermopsis aphanizomenoides BCCUSP55]|uniref:MOSC domain-containing protein n=1 Tax=Sphaerospermopsis aphanizomenoides TaxID=459663 RepID=UPI001908A44E|nr:MOSC N-terminal beta barrel domain-containing protein [Sphaerospermopsis aphanizomenoides]MBK1990786.1 MOSC N-terminal beta barrel domain-containing protein [Sphaerospermopsis aphanizomenoides BCCUSP55]
MPCLSKILLYPIKSLDGVEVEKATVLPSGALCYDREFAILDAQGKFVNAKRHTKIQLLRSEFSLNERIIHLQLPGHQSPQIFHLDQELKGLEATLSDFFGFTVKLVQNTNMGFPDDTNSPGPTVISTATLTEVASWFPGMSVNEIRRRMRANIEIDGVPAFWEDRLFTASGETVSFVVGNVQFLGINSCQRCVVPTRDSYLGEAYPNFQKIFVQKRQATMPAWVDASIFNHFYRLSVNTRVAASEVGKTIEVGNNIEISL